MPPRRDPGHSEVPQATVVAQFCDYNFEKLSSQGDPRVIDEWVQGLEMIFELIREKHYPAYYRAEMERQFLSLQQGTHTVDEYEREFTRLGAFVPDLVSTEAKRSRRFTDGLLPAVRHNIVGHGTQTYARTVTIAQEVDASIWREANHGRLQPSGPVQSSTVPPIQPAVAQQPKDKKRKGRGFQNDRRNHRRQQGAARPQQIPPCTTCGRPHRGERHFGHDICYYCHQPGHF
ncbi:Unknown protein, partial [Striga hermonthica]